MDYIIERSGCSFRTTCPFPFKFCKFVPQGLPCDLTLWFKSFMLLLWIFESFQFRFLGKFWYRQDFLKYIACLIFIKCQNIDKGMIKVPANFQVNQIIGSLAINRQVMYAKRSKIVTVRPPLWIFFFKFRFFQFFYSYEPFYIKKYKGNCRFFKKCLFIVNPP